MRGLTWVRIFAFILEEDALGCHFVVLVAEIELVELDLVGHGLLRVFG